jgi:hypothetical protein
LFGLVGVQGVEDQVDLSVRILADDVIQEIQKLPTASPWVVPHLN